MKSIQNKITYTTPKIEQIVLDNEISLQLESTSPPFGPDEANNTVEYFKNEPLLI